MRWRTLLVQAALAVVAVALFAAVAYLGLQQAGTCVRETEREQEMGL